MCRKTTSDHSHIEGMFGTVGNRLKTFLARSSVRIKRRPKMVFALMLVCMLISGILAFTKLRAEKGNMFNGQIRAGAAIGNGLGEIFDAGRALGELLELNGKINTLLAKDTLGRNDSLELAIAIERLERIQGTHQFNQTSKP